MSSVWIEKRKPCGSVRRRWAARPLGHDVWGDWFALPDDGGVLLMPVADPWVAGFRADGSVRVDVATDVLVAAPVSSFVDLDLDVERDARGVVRLLDREDFVRRAPAYPRPWVDLAWEAWGDVERDLTCRVEPFGTASDLWLRRVAPVGLPDVVPATA
ncbi:hypothetical protein [Isoptericola aurantiacus]|uniref:hypothetical protein n=1 Tax=Isoptericola aurantiacus TaxID=3377839 RepID=UPI00383A4845